MIRLIRIALAALLVSIVAAPHASAQQELTFSLGRMVNGVGGSIIHYGGWLRRFPAHNFRLRSHALDRWGAGSGAALSYA